MTQGNRTFLFGILDGPVFTPSDAIVLGHEDVEGGLWASLWHAPPSFFHHWPSFKLFGLIILGGHSSPMMTSLPLVNSA
jgi:hypothetical protein